MSPDAFDAAPFPIFIHQDRRICYHNPATRGMIRALGYDPEAPGSFDVFDCIAPEERSRALENYELLMMGGKRSHAILRTFITRSGGRFRVVASVVRTEWRGRPALWIGLLWRDGVGAPQGAAPLPARDDAEQRSAVLARLSPRERQVVALVADGFATREVAALLTLRESTVRAHLKSIFRKLAVHSRVELARLLHGGA